MKCPTLVLLAVLMMTVLAHGRTVSRCTSFVEDEGHSYSEEGTRKCEADLELTCYSYYADYYCETQDREKIAKFENCCKAHFRAGSKTLEIP